MKKTKRLRGSVQREPRSLGAFETIADYLHRERLNATYGPAGAKARLVKEAQLDATRQAEVQRVKAQQQQKPLRDHERENLQKQIAALALALAEVDGQYKRGGKPILSKLADHVGTVVESLPHANLKGVSVANVRKSLAAGLKLLADE